MHTKRILTFITVFTCLKFTWQLLIPKPDTVLVPVPINLLDNIDWLSYYDNGNIKSMQSTCGMIEAYEGPIEKIVGRWYTMYVSNIPTESKYCSHFTNVKRPCGCMGIDFTTSLGHGLTSFVMFSTDTDELTTTYEVVTASILGKKQFIINQLVLLSFTAKNMEGLLGNGGYIIPNGIVILSDNFESYMVLLFCKEGAMKPIIMILANALPMSKDAEATIHKYLTEKGFDTNLSKVYAGCRYAKNIIGL